MRRSHQPEKQPHGSTSCACWAEGGEESSLQCTTSNLPPRHARTHTPPGASLHSSSARREAHSSAVAESACAFPSRSFFVGCALRRGVARSAIMSDAVNAAYERSEQLRQQWEQLKSDMLAIDPSQPEAATRRDELRAQMDHVMNQLSSVVSETRRLVPNANAIDDEEPIMEARPVQYSANHRHVIYRTYESSDSSDGEGSLSVPDVPEEPPKSLPKPPVHPVQPVRLASPPTSPTTDVSLLPSPQTNRVSVQAKRSSLATFKKGIRGKLRLNDSNSNTPRGANPTEPTMPAPVAKQSRESLVVEQNLLERESRRLKRKPYRSPDDDKRLLDIAGALSRISSTLAEMPENASPPQEESHEDVIGVSSPQGHCRDESITEKDIQLSPFSEDDNNRPFDSQSVDSPIHSKPNKSSHPKRKKGWGAIEAGFASFKALGRTVRHAAAAASSRTDPKQEPSRAKDRTKSAHNAQDLFSETVTRVQERGEKLEGVAEESEQMTNDANDMLAAARALNQRHKGGFFS
ncbi:hypothetical protein FGB62_71g014 [Gracilaria domingensis]|nr:hypothetical protein FGB62_71g014 [Gracilaria domingensis]